MEESCNLNGLYPSGQGEEFSLQHQDWTYSSLDGLQRPQDSLEKNPQEWDTQVPVWIRAGRQTLTSFLPEGIELSEGVQGCETRIYPQQQRAQIHIALSQPLKLNESSKKLEEVWPNLPAGSQIACLHREVASRLLSTPGPASLVEKLWETSDTWAGIAIQEDLSQPFWNSAWKRIQNNRLPLASWTDCQLENLQGANYVQIASQEIGTSFMMGSQAHKNTGTAPWSHWPEVQKWLGTGRCRLQHSDATWRLEWALHQSSPRQLTIEAAWSAEPPEEPQEIATAGPDLEKLYNTKSNVQAGE